MRDDGAVIGNGAAGVAWGLPPETLSLGGREVHLFRISLILPERLGDEGARLLSQEEQVRASRFAFEVHRSRYVAGRSALRQILAAYCGVEPGSLVFAYSERGRPRLACPSGESFDFNLAHSEDLGLVAVSRSPVGVDVERVRELPDAVSLVERCFTPAEAAAFVRLPPEQRAPAFFQAWTGKESILKALGVGLSGLPQVQGTLEPLGPVKVTLPGAEGPWSFCRLEPSPGFVGAVAAKVAAARLFTWAWP